MENRTGFDRLYWGKVSGNKATVELVLVILKTSKFKGFSKKKKKRGGRGRRGWA